MSPDPELGGVSAPGGASIPPSSGGGAWGVEVARGSAADFHGRDVLPGAGRQVWVQHVEGAALVLGSTQPDTVDRAAARAAGVDVVRRRSGGGAVLVEPGGTVWVDVVVPPDDPLWDDDVGRAAHWVGEAWATALARLGVADAVVHRGGLVTTAWSRQVCFAGMGPGEVAVHGRKVVGVAQRRTRHGARFQTAALLRWDPATLVRLLGLPPEAEVDVAGRAAAVPVPVGGHLDGDTLVSALLDALPG